MFEFRMPEFSMPEFELPEFELPKLEFPGSQPSNSNKDGDEGIQVVDGFVVSGDDDLNGLTIAELIAKGERQALQQPSVVSTKFRTQQMVVSLLELLYPMIVVDTRTLLPGSDGRHEKSRLLFDVVVVAAFDENPMTSSASTLMEQHPSLFFKANCRRAKLSTMKPYLVLVDDYNLLHMS